MYKCHICKRQFISGLYLNPAIIWQEYVKGKQTYVQLVKKYNCSTRTIQRKIDTHKVQVKNIEPREVIVLMDTTYWKRGFGMILFKDSITKENLFKYYGVIDNPRKMKNY